jgi:glycosyltransferase involved in cell wall biosynthesis
MTALRIALIAHNRFPIRQPFAGGLEAHVWQLARALVQAGQEVTLYAADGSDLGVDHPRLTISPLRCTPAAAQPFPLPGATKESDHHAYLDLMANLAGPRGACRFDLIHNHSLHHVTIAMAPRLQTPMLTTLHTPPFPWLEAAIGASGCPGAKYAAVSQYTADSWSRVVGKPIAVVTNGVDLAAWPSGLGGDYLVWTGRITPEKGPHLAIEAATRAGRPLVLAGPIGNSDYFRIRVKPALSERIRYAGHLDQPGLAALVGGAAAALVTPMWDEPYCLVIAEALSCGTPVVAFDRGGISEVLGTPGGQLVAAGDVAAMAAAVAEVATVPRDRVRAYAANTCSADVMVSRYLMMYRELIDEESAGINDRLLRAPSRTRSSGEDVEHLRTPA